LLEDPGGEPLKRLIGAPMETGRFLRLAIGIVAALGKLAEGFFRAQSTQPIALFFRLLGASGQLIAVRLIFAAVIDSPCHSFSRFFSGFCCIVKLINSIQHGACAGESIHQSQDRKD
jgi:hypothetical protein